MRILAIAALAALVHAGDKDPKQWAEDVPFVTDWDTAIKEARNTGRILFIYNGWERPGV